MKIQIQRFSLHQNAKVMALMMAISSLIFLIPYSLVMWIILPRGVSIPWGLVIFAPLIYLVLGYISIIIGCLIYNALARKIGGMEYFADVTRSDTPGAV